MTEGFIVEVAWVVWYGATDSAHPAVSRESKIARERRIMIERLMGLQRREVTASLTASARNTVPANQFKQRCSLVERMNV